MDKAEYRMRLDEITKLVDSQDYEGALELVDSIDWKRVKSVRTLCMVAEIYEINGELDQSMKILQLAYKRSSVGKTILYRQVELALKMGAYDDAVKYYNQYLETASNDTSKYILKYKIYRAQNAPLDDQIAILEEYKDREYTERWVYELARLYHKAGKKNKCVETCDDLILWFGEGKYVTKAMEMKMVYTPLTAAQQEKYDKTRKPVTSSRIQTVKMPELNTDIPSAPDTDEKSEAASARGSVTDREQEVAVTEEPQIQHVDIEALQERLNKSFQEVLSGFNRTRVVDAFEVMGRSVSSEPQKEAIAEEDISNYQVTDLEPEPEVAAPIKADKGVAIAHRIETPKAPKKEEVPVEKPEDKEAVSIQELDLEALFSETSKALAEAAGEAVGQAVDQMETDEQPAESEEAAVAFSEPVADIAKANADAAVKEQADEAPIEEVKAAEEPIEEAEAAEEAAEEPIEETAAAEEAAEEPIEETEAAEEAAEEPIGETAAAEEAAEEPIEETAAAEEAAEEPIEETAAAEEAAEEPIEETAVAEETEAAEEPIEEMAAAETKPEGSDIEEAEEPAIHLVIEEPEVVEEAADVEQLIEAVSAETEAVDDADADIAMAAFEASLAALDFGEAKEESSDDTMVIPQIVLPGDEEDEAEASSKEAADESDAEETAAEETVEEAAENDSVPEKWEIVPEIDEEEPENKSESDKAAEKEAEKETEIETEIEQKEARMESGKEPEEETFDPLLDLDIIQQLEREHEAEREKMVTPEPETPEEKRYRILNATKPEHLTNEQKNLFSYFAKVPGMDEQILNAINGAYQYAGEKTSRRGNIAIMGSHGTGKTRLSEGLIKAICKQFGLEAVKYANLDASDMNQRDPATVIGKMAGGFLLIERASFMNAETVQKLSQAMDFRTDSMILLIEDDKANMRKFLADNPEFAKKFETVISIPVFTNDELVTFARTYAKENGYRMDEMGVLALYTLIGNNQRADEPITIGKVKEMVDGAIARANSSRLGIRLSKRRTDEDGRILLYEKDFDM